MTVFTRRLTRRRAAVAGVFAAGLLIAGTACGSSSASGPSSASMGSSSSAVHTVKDAKLGTIVVNGKGFTLYRFDADTAKPPASHCTGTCAVRWPAAPATSANTVKGIDHKLIGSVTGSGGGKQLTINGWPVYTYALDSKAGDTHGQGVDGTWWAVTPTGGKAMTTTSMSPSTMSPSTGGSGY